MLIYFGLDKGKLGTITGISNFQEWTWFQDEEKRVIFVRVLYQELVFGKNIH